MGAVQDQAGFAAALKQMYKEPTVADLTYKNNVALAMMKKSEDFYGDVEKYPALYAPTAGRSATFSDALANQQASQLQAFLLQRKSDYSIASIAGETIEASRNNSGAFISAIKNEMDQAFAAIGRSLNISLWRGGTGTIGQISAGSNVATPTITLANINDVVAFEVGQTIQASVTDGGAVEAGSVFITNVNRSTGELTASGNWSAGIGTIAAGDFLLMSGDSNAKVSGFSSWIPLSPTVSATPFFGVDRSVDKARLAGVYLDRTGVPIEEALIDGVTEVGINGGSPDMIGLHPKKFADLVKSLGSKVQYINMQSPDGYFGFSSILLHGAAGSVKVFADRDCPSDRAMIFSWDTWSLRSLNKAPHILGLDGLDFLRNGNGDSYQIRVGYYAQVKCLKPGHNGVVKLS